jgi:3-hydroxyisobutyrate dehydrogenase-like beta-hydroxyacid dehydrogenase
MRIIDADIDFTMLSTPEAVWESAAGEEGFLGEMKHGALWCDCTTVNPDFSREMANLSESFGIRFMDTPVAGSKNRPKKGTWYSYAAEVIAIWKK